MLKKSALPSDWDTIPLNVAAEDSLRYLEQWVGEAIKFTARPYKAPEDVVNDASNARARKGLFNQQLDKEPPSFILADLECVEWQDITQEDITREESNSRIPHHIHRVAMQLTMLHLHSTG